MFGERLRATPRWVGGCGWPSGTWGARYPGRPTRPRCPTPAEYAFCIAEEEEDTPWAPLHVDRGCPPGSDAVTVFACEGPHSVFCYGTPEEMLHVLTDSMRALGNDNMHVMGQTLVVAESAQRRGSGQAAVRRSRTSGSIFGRRPPPDRRRAGLWRRPRAIPKDRSRTPAGIHGATIWRPDRSRRIQKHVARLFLIDGSSQMYRAYHAIRGLTGPDGRSTNAVYGFSTMLRKLIADQSPEYIAASFDLAGPTFRDELAADYKANRTPMPSDLADQVPLVREACEALGVPILTYERYEADDVIGTLTTQARAEGFDVAIVTGDKDFFQLVADGISRLQPARRGHVVRRRGRVWKNLACGRTRSSTSWR